VKLERICETIKTVRDEMSIDEVKAVAASVPSHLTLG
jgi:hypothetical protein